MRTTLPVLVLAATVACATNPVTGKRERSLLSEAEELAIGQQADAEIRREMGVYADQELQRYVSDIGMRMAQLSHRPNLPWSFTVLDNPAINAFAVPGGYVYITRGILAYLGDEAELAGVLGHEIGHITARHAAQHLASGHRRLEAGPAQHLRAENGTLRRRPLHGTRHALPEIRTRP